MDEEEENELVSWRVAIGGLCKTQIEKGKKCIENLRNMTQSLTV